MDTPSKVEAQDPMSEPVLQSQYMEIRDLAERLARAVYQFAGLKVEGNPALNVPVYEANRRLEDVVHRVSDCFFILMHRSTENCERIVSGTEKKPDAVGGITLGV